MEVSVCFLREGDPFFICLPCTEAFGIEVGAIVPENFAVSSDVGESVSEEDDVRDIPVIQPRIMEFPC